MIPSILCECLLASSSLTVAPPLFLSFLLLSLRSVLWQNVDNIRTVNPAWQPETPTVGGVSWRDGELNTFKPEVLR